MGSFLPDKKPLVLTTGKHPFEVATLVVMTILGVVFLTGVNPPPTIAQAAPLWLLYSWFTLLFLGGAVGLVGVLWRNIVTGLHIEQASMIFLGTGAAFYALTLASLVPGPGKAAIATWSVICISSISRWVQIRRELKKQRSAVMSPNVVQIEVLSEGGGHEQ